MSLSIALLDHVFAVPGEDHIIDGCHPETGRSAINGETLAEIQLRYPGAVLMTWDQFAEPKAARQNRPIVWTETSPEQYDEMLCVLPPAAWLADGFLVGEPDDHCILTGRARFRAYRRRGDGVCEVANRPMTIADFRSLFVPVSADPTLTGGR